MDFAFGANHVRSALAAPGCAWLGLHEPFPRLAGPDWARAVLVLALVRGIVLVLVLVLGLGLALGLGLVLVLVKF